MKYNILMCQFINEFNLFLELKGFKFNCNAPKKKFKKCFVKIRFKYPSKFLSSVELSITNLEIWKTEIWDSKLILKLCIFL